MITGDVNTRLARAFNELAAGGSESQSDRIQLFGEIAAMFAILANIALPVDVGAFAQGDGVTDDSSAILAAEAVAYATGGVLVFPSGKTFFTGTTTLNLRCAVDGAGATIKYAGTGVAVIVGQSSTPTLWLQVRLPKVIQSLKTIVGWAQAGGADVGVRLLNLYSSQVYIPRVNNFAVGLDVRGEGRGCVYNHIYVGHLDNNKVNQQLSADATGWSNENQYYIGRWSFNSGEGVNVAGTRDVLVLPNASVSNNNHWWGGAHEGTVQEFHVECYGDDNSWHKNRWESATNCKVQFNSANAVGNEINGGYQASGIILTEINGALKNKITSRDYFRQEGSGGAAGIMQFSNTSSDAMPVLVGLPAGVRPSAAVDTDRTMKLSSTTLEGKARGDANPRIKMDFVNGRILFSDGTVAPATEYIRRFGSDGIQHVGTKLGFFGATPVVKGSLPVAAVDAATTQALVNAIRTLLISLGLTS